MKINKTLSNNVKVKIIGKVNAIHEKKPDEHWQNKIPVLGY